jgi:hypothetical protein
MPRTRPAGFLDLPLELRQMIYGYILPADRVMNFPASEYRLKEEMTVSTVCAAAPEVKEELEELAFEECSAHIAVTPHKEMETSGRRLRFTFNQPICCISIAGSSKFPVK